MIDRVWEYLGIDLSEVPVEDWFTVESYTSGGYNDEMTVGGYDTVQKSVAPRSAPARPLPDAFCGKTY